MNCYEWRKRIQCTISAQVDLNLTTGSLTESGSQNFTHDELYSTWTRRELQCEGAPLNPQNAWILRGDNLCEGRSILMGVLTQNETMTVTQVFDGVTTTYEAGLYFQTQQFGIWKTNTNLLAMSPYPNWENDPYSKAARNVIDGLTGNYLYAGIYNIDFGPPPDSVGIPSAPVALKWLKDQATGTNSEYGLTVTLTVTTSLPG